MKRFLTLCGIATVAAFAPNRAEAQSPEFVDFVNGSWLHGGSTSTGWDSTELIGTFTMTDGNRVTMTVSFAGTATATSQNLAVISETYFNGFAFQMDPVTNDNPSGVFNNYERIDLEFDIPVTIDEFVIMDVDREGWDDVLYAEGWLGSGSVGTLGSGLPATYGFRSPTNLAEESVGGFNQVVVASGGNTVSGPESDLFIDFGQAVNAISIYYSNGDWDNSDSTQTIGLQGNGFSVVTVPEPSVPLLLGLAAMLRLSSRRRPRSL